MEAKSDALGFFLTSEGKPTHFRVAELACRDKCGEARMEQTQIDALETFRLKVARPVWVGRGVSCVAHNAAVGGSPTSEHLPIGLATDITVLGVPDETAFEIAAKIFNRVGLYFRNSSLHVDMKVTATGEPVHLYWFRDVATEIVDEVLRPIRANGGLVYSQYKYFISPEECLAAYLKRKQELGIES